MSLVPGNFSGTTYTSMPTSSMAGIGPSILGGVFDVLGGFQAEQAYNSQAGALQAQSDQAIRAAIMNAQAKANDVRQIAGEQQEQYASSGVTLAGTPAQVLADTRFKGQQEVNAIQQQGAFQAQLMRTQANQARSSGRSSMLGGLLKAGMGLAAFL
jgi:hypothetical protein